MSRLLLAFLFAGTATPAVADSFTIKPLADLRLRYENVDQEGPPPIARDADAFTLRVRAGGELANKDWSFLVEGEGTLAISEKYNSGLNGKTLFPIVADPENIELDRIQVQYRGLPRTVVTLGRQRINLDDQRFVGSVGWRQNEQTFDAAQVEWSGVKDLKLDLVYSWSVRTIWGIDGGNSFGPARQQAVSGDNVFANASYKTRFGTLTGFAYLVDQDEAVISGFRNSSRTFGARFAGSAPLGKSVKLNYAASYAIQSAYHHNPNDYSADYYLLEGGLAVSGFTGTLGYEVLGANDGVLLTSFQTPLATLHKFQGWADKFLVTPPNGLHDYYASAGYGWKKVAGLDSISASVAYHRFDSDRLDLHYGNERNALISAKKGRWTATAKLASYDADDFATDTHKLWLQLEWAY